MITSAGQTLREHIVRLIFAFNQKYKKTVIRLQYIDLAFQAYVLVSHHPMEMILTPR